MLSSLRTKSPLAGQAATEIRAIRELLFLTRFGNLRVKHSRIGNLPGQNCTRRQSVQNKLRTIVIPNPDRVQAVHSFSPENLYQSKFHPHLPHAAVSQR